MLLCCTGLTNHLNPGKGQHVLFTLLYNWIDFFDGQISIETATHSLVQLKNIFSEMCEYSALLTLTVTEIHPMTYGQGQGYHFLGHQS